MKFTTSAAMLLFLLTANNICRVDAFFGIESIGTAIKNAIIGAFKLAKIKVQPQDR
jgi:hypothetical protein